MLGILYDEILSQPYLQHEYCFISLLYTPHVVTWYCMTKYIIILCWVTFEIFMWNIFPYYID